ncbi:MAG: FecR domain-containing protein [Bauldia sp.]
MLRLSWVFKLALGLAASCEAAVAAPAGSVVGYTALGLVIGGDGQQAAEVGFPIFMGDRLQTGPTGQLQIVFADASKLVVGPNSAMTVDDFVFRRDGTASSFALTATRGAFRFVSGQSPKPAYSIRTPTAVMALRGTAFDLAVSANGDSALALFAGAAEICGADRRCALLSGACSMAVTGIALATRPVTALPERNGRLREDFPYVVSQAPLRQDFRLPVESCGDIRAAAIPLPLTPGLDFGGPAGQRPGPIAPPSPPGPPPVGNPGNGGPNGNAGPNPGGNDMGEPGRGRSDDNPGHGNSGDHGGGNGHGKG